MRLSLVDIRDTVFVALACAFAGLLVLGMPSAGLPLCALALGWLTFRRGVVSGIAVAIGSALLLSVLAGPALGALLAPVLIAVGPFAATALKKRSPWYVVSVILVVGLLAAAGSMGLQALAEKTDIAGMMHNSVMTWAGLFQPAPSQAEAAQLTQVARELSYQWPGWLTLNVGLGALLAVYALGVQADRAGVTDVRKLPPLHEIDLSWHVAWGAIAGLAMLAVARFTGQQDGTIGVVGLNVMRLTGGLLALQGFAVFAGLYRKAGFGMVARGVGFTFLAVTEPLTAVLVPMGLVGLTGLIDLWANLRKLPRNGLELAPEDPEDPLDQA
jgi:hypothetical protein